MNMEALFLFLILLLGLLLCSFLGGSHCNKENFTGNFSGTFNINEPQNNNYNGASTTSTTQYDNYNHYNGSSTQLINGSVYVGPGGGTATVMTSSDGSQSLRIKLPNSNQTINFQSNTTVDNSGSTVESYTNYYGYNGTATTFYGPNGDTATVVDTNNGQQAIKVTTSTGTYYYNTTDSVNNNTNTTTQYYGSTGTPIEETQYSTAYGGSAGSVTGPQGNTVYYAQGPNGNTVTGSTSNSTQYYGQNGGSAGSVTGPQGNTVYYAQGPNGNTVATNGNENYYNTLPPGIPRSQIPPGQEDLYILKSEVVPPVCPACPTISNIANASNEEKCPPCPACARCPEPSFECKKVPNYNAINNDYLPAPVLSDFSQFGM